MSEATEYLNKLGEAFQDFRGINDKKISDLTSQLNAIETAVARGQFAGGGKSSGNNFADQTNHKAAFDKWFRKGIDNGLRDLEIQAGLRTSSDPDGGFLVPVELDRSLDRVASASVAMRRLSNIVTLDSGDYQRPISQGGTGSGWVGELDTRDETASPTLKMFSPAWSELFAMPEVTQTLLDLAGFDVSAWLQDEISIAELELEGAAFISGNGVGKPKGILAYDTIANSSWSFGKVGFVAGGHASLLASSDALVDLQHALKPAYRSNAAWLMNDTTWSVIRKLKDGEGNYLWRPGLEPGAADVLLGKAVEIDDNMPAVGAGSFPVAFGDFKRAYTIGGHKVGRRLLRDELTKKGFVKFYMSKRVFGGLHNSEAVKLLKIAV